MHRTRITAVPIGDRPSFQVLICIANFGRTGRRVPFDSPDGHRFVTNLVIETVNLWVSVGGTSAALERFGEGAAGGCFARAQRQRVGGGARGGDPGEPTVWMAAATASTAASGGELWQRCGLRRRARRLACRLLA